MSDYYTRQLVREKTARKFCGHDKLYARYLPRFPDSAEREYIRLTAEYMGIVKEALEKELPNIKEAYRRERDLAVGQGQRADSMEDIIDGIFKKMGATADRKCKAFGYRKKLESMARLNRKLTVKEWKKAVSSTLGIDIREDYYLGEFYREAMDSWVGKNVDLIKTIPSDTLGRMKEIVKENFLSGKPTTQMARQMQAEYSISKRHLRLIARDQTAKLNGEIQRAQQQDAGIEEYTWYTCCDQRVRGSHKKLHGKQFKWSDPPLTERGRHCHPGEDYQCRCIARPVFNRNMSLPLADAGMKVTVNKGGW